MHTKRAKTSIKDPKNKQVLSGLLLVIVGGSEGRGQLFPLAMEVPKAFLLKV